MKRFWPAFAGGLIGAQLGIILARKYEEELREGAAIVLVELLVIVIGRGEERLTHD